MATSIGTLAKLPPAAVVISGDSDVAVANEEASRQTAVQVRSIPTAMWDKHKDRISAFIRHEISRAETERDSFFLDVARWKILYAAPPNFNAKTWPVANAANVTVPMIKEIVNTLASQVVQSTMTSQPRWILKDLAPEWEQFVHPIEGFLDAAATRELGYDEAMIPAIIETCKIGTSILEVNYEVDIVRSWRYTSDGSEAYVKDLVKRDGPKVRNLPLQNFWIRFSETDIQEAPWVAKEVWLNEQQLRQKIAQGKFSKKGGEHVLAFKERQAKDDDVKQVEEDLANTHVIEWSKYQIFEIHMRWDVDDDPDHLDEDIVVYWHRSSNTVLNATFAPYWHGRRPFKKMGYFPRPNQFYDEGLAEMLEQIQVAVSATQNRRSDNALMANLKMIIKRRSVKGIMPGDPLYGGKVIEVNDVHNDIKEFQMAEIYPSTVNEEMILRGYAERLSGFNDAAAGAAQPVTRTTATAQLALLQEQARRLDLTIRNIRGTQTEIGRVVVALYQQYGTLGKAIAWLGEPGKAVEAIFSLPRRVTEIGDALRVSSPTSTQNRQVKRENSIQMFNLINQMYQQLIPLMAQMVGPEQLAPIIHDMVSGAKRFMGDALESFEVSNPDEVLSALTLMEQILPDARDLGGLEDFERAEAQSKIIEGVSRVEALLRQAEGASSRGPGIIGGSGANGTAPESPGTAQGNLASLFLGGGPTGNG